MKTIAILATLDTKGDEAQFLCDQVRDQGCVPLLIDTGVVGTPAATADITREEVAEAGGISLSRLLDHADREIAAPVMANGAATIVAGLVAQGKIDGVLGIGGTQGTTLCTHVMRALPYGLPKVMLSTMASGNVAPWVDIKDITMMFSVTDILGLNAFARKILANAAGAVCGMAHSHIKLEGVVRPLVGITTVGITTLGAMKAKETLESAGYETIIFHAVGSGGRAMEQLMREGYIGAVLDYAMLEVSNEMHHALLAGGADRLTTAGKLGIPQVLCPGAIEVLVFGEPDTVPKKFADRTLIRHSPQITDVRLNKEEMAEVADEVLRRLTTTTGNAIFIIPTKGFDSYAVAGEGFYDPEADRALIDKIKNGIPEGIKLIEVNTDINDPKFAILAAESLIGMMKAGL